MVNLRLKKMELQELRLWAYAYRDEQINTGVVWEEDQENLLTKLNLALDKLQLQNRLGGVE